MPLTREALLIITALNDRGIAGPRVRTLLRHYSHERIARQIDYYDYELFSKGAQLPPWAAAPWLEYRIKRDRPAPEGFLERRDARVHQELLRRSA